MIPNSLTFDGLGGARRDAYEMVSPQTDYKAEEINDVLCAAAMMSRCANKIGLLLMLGVSPIVLKYDSSWKMKTPNVPSIVRNGVGDYDIVFPASVVAEDDSEESVNLRFAQCSVVSGDFGFVKISASANVINIKIANTSGAASDLSSGVVSVGAF